MGSEISLAVGQLEIDSGKNNHFMSHVKLFLPGDLTTATYSYAGNQRQRKPAFRRNLQSVRRRLALLGYSMERCREIFEATAADLQHCDIVPTISWSDFTSAVNAVNLDRTATFCGDWGCTPGEYAQRCILARPSLKHLSPRKWQQRHKLGLTLESLNPYVTLCVLANNPRNRRRYVVWRHADVLEAGWIEEKAVAPRLRPEDKYLVVTEGSSDSAILQRSLNLLFPDVADFFTFIDMKEHYPFTGTGNLGNFCKGLAKIGIQNKVLVVFDNDTAGLEALHNLKDVTLPKSMKMTALPNMESLKKFRTIGPNGLNYEDVNGKAASIELYLDLRYGGPKKPIVRWTSYSERLGTYQGELVKKKQYANAFFKVRGATKGYSLARLRNVWKSLFITCTGEPF